MNNASKGRCVTITPQGKNCEISPSAYLGQMLYAALKKIKAFIKSGTTVNAQPSEEFLYFKIPP